MKSRRSLAAAAFVVAALVAPSVTRADTVTDWTATATSTILAPNPTAHASTISLAMVQGAMYDAVNSIDLKAGRGYQPYLADVDAQPFDSRDAAAATAAYTVLVDLFPAQQGALEDLREASLLAIPDGAAEDGGVAAGEAAAEAMLTAREIDGRNAPFTPVIGTGPGDWRPVTPAALDPGGWVGYVKPFLIESPEQFRSEGPHPLTSRAYAEEFDEVKELGALNSTKRTDDETRAAIFWQAQPGALWNGAFRSISADRGLDVSENARLFATLWLAAADGAISCWNDKYYWNFWRPMAAIREADTDGNPATGADPSWTPLFHPSVGPGLGTPPFPDHPSGHGCVSGSLLYAAQDFFGTDKVEFDVFSSRFPGEPRHFDRFSHAVKEIIDARVWGGIHFRNADVQGTVIGKKVAHYLRKHYFQPVG